MFLLITNKNLRLEKYIIFYILFFIYQTIVNSLKIPDYSFNFKQLYLNNYLIPIFVFILIENTVIQSDIYEQIIKISKVILVFATIIIVYQATINNQFLVYTTYMEEWYSTDIVPRYPSIYSWLSQFGIGLVFIPTLGLVIGDKLFKNEKNILPWYLMGFIVAFLSLFRWVMLNMLLLIPMYVIAKKINVLNILKITIYVIFIVAATYFILKAVGINLDAIINDRILQDNAHRDIQSNSAYTRILAFQLFFDFFPKNPIWGHGGYLGYDLVTRLAGRSSQIHVGYLSLLYYWGIVGGILYLLFMYFLFKKLYRIAKITNNWSPFLGWVCFALANSTLVILGPNQAGLYLSLAVAKYFENKVVIEPQIYTSNSKLSKVLITNLN